MKQIKILLMCFLTCTGSVAFAQKVIQRYDGKPKGSENWTWSEQATPKNQHGQTLVYNVVQPTITAYLPSRALATGTAVIIAPGGAFHILSMDNEGYKVAQ